MILLVDANNLYARAWYATRNEAMTADGESTAAMVVFVNTLVRIIRTRRPDRVAVCWDGGSSVYRTRLLPSYKANRMAKISEMRTGRDQVHEFLALAEMFQVERSGVEADDLIAKYWYDADEEVMVFSDDKDFLMLAGTNPQGHLCRVHRAQGAPWTDQMVFDHTGAWPKDLPDVMALTGDVSDNILGVSGIGPKKAVALLEESGWSLEAIERPEVQERLSQVLLNRVLVNLRLPLPGLLLPTPPAFKPTGAGSVLYVDLVDFMTRYELGALLTKLYTGTLWGGDDLIGSSASPGEAV
jgi:DNA polymerase-1